MRVGHARRLRRPPSAKQEAAALPPIHRCARALPKERTRKAWALTRDGLCFLTEGVTGLGVAAGTVEGTEGRAQASSRPMNRVAGRRSKGSFAEPSPPRPPHPPTAASLTPFFAFVLRVWATRARSIV